MSLVKCKDKRTGVTYVYESESYWDKEKKQPRAKRKLIGKIDEETGEIVPTGGRGRKPKEPKEEPEAATNEISDYLLIIEKKDIRISELENENRELKKEIDTIAGELESILERCKSQK